LLGRAGAEITNDASDADVIVVNTCSFIESAQQESVNTILEMARTKPRPGTEAVVADASSSATATIFKGISQK